jgi:hypothetical protein
VNQVPQDAISVVDDLTAADSFDVRDEPDATAVMFVLGIVETLLWRRSI